MSWRTRTSWVLCVAAVFALSAGVFAQPVTIVYGHTDANPVFVRLVELFNESHDDIKVELRAIGNYDDALPVEIASGVGPDVFFVNANNVVAWARYGLLADLTPFVERDAHLLQIDSYFPLALAISQVDGRYYSWPYGITELGRLMYNKDIFDQAGMLVPDESWDWEEFREAARRLSIDRNADGVFDQWGTNPMNHREVYHYMLQLGGRLYTDDLTVYLPDRQPVVEAIRFAASLVWEGITNRQVGGGPWNNGQVAMYFHHFPGAVSALSQVHQAGAFQSGSTVQPMHPNGVRKILFTTNMFGINPNSPNKEAAWEFIRWAMEEDGYPRAGYEAFGVSQLVPPRSDVALTRYFSEVDPTLAPVALNPTLSIRILTEWGVPEIVPPGHSRVYSMFTNGLRQVEDGAIPPESFYESIVPQINAMLADYR